MGLYQGAEMIAGAGITPSISIDDNTKHWIINGIDTGIVAEGKTQNDIVNNENEE